MDYKSLPDGLGLRMAITADQAFIESLFHQSHEAFYAAEQEDDYIRMIIDHQLLLQAQAYGENYTNSVNFIVEKQGIAIGRLVLDFGKNIAHILDINLIKEAQGRGYGKSIIQAVQFIGQKQGVPVGLSVNINNLRAKALYAKLGFILEEASQTHDFMVWHPKSEKIFIGT